MTIILSILFVLISTFSLTAGEFRTIHDSGLDPSSIAVGNVIGFNHTALGVLETPTLKESDRHEASMYYAYLMGGDATISATAIKLASIDHFHVSLGAVLEQSDAGFRTTSANGVVTAGEALQYLSSEYVVNASISPLENVIVGISGHYIYRDQFGINGSGLGMSIGISYEDKDFGLNAGGNYINSPVIAFSNGASESRLAQYYGGVKFSIPFELPLLAYAQLRFTPEANALQRAGGLRVMLTDTLDVSVGYMESRGIRNDLSSHVTAGLGLLLNDIKVNYAFNTVDYIESPSQHRISLSILF